MHDIAIYKFPTLFYCITIYKSELQPELFILFIWHNCIVFSVCIASRVDTR